MMRTQTQPGGPAPDAWPTLPYAAWKETCATLQLWTQIVGKVQLALTPFLNEWWNVAFHLTARGLTTGLIPYQERAFEVRFDFMDHTLYIATDTEATKTLSLRPRTVAAFYGEVMAMLQALGISVTINPLPCEVPHPIPCDVNETHASYDAEAVTRWWRIQLQSAKVLQVYRSTFVGKSSPIQFFWGSFDLNHTRFSGRPAPLPQGVPRFFQLAEDQENVACGFWPGNPNSAGVELGEPAFYAYIYPEPDGFTEAPVRPDVAHYDPRLGEFIPVAGAYPWIGEMRAGCPPNKQPCGPLPESLQHITAVDCIHVHMNLYPASRLSQPTLCAPAPILTEILDRRTAPISIMFGT